MAETRWLVWTLPGGEVEQSLKDRGIVLTLSVPSIDREVVEAIETAAGRAGMTLTRWTPEE